MSMIKGFITIFIFLVSLTVNSQEYSKKDFVKTEWFTNNLDSFFFSSDTIRLIKHLNKGPEWAKDEYAEFEMKYLEHGDYLNFGFMKSGDFKYLATYNNYMNIVLIDPLRWKFDKAHGTIKVYRKKELFFELKPISSRPIEIESRFSEHTDVLLTEEWTFIKIATVSD